MVALTLHYRDAATTLRCITALSAEGLDHVLVWDNSEDEAASVTELQRQLGDQPHVSFVVSPVNLGFAAGANAGMSWLGQRFPGVPVLLINNDARLLPGAARQLLDAFHTNAGVRVVCPSIAQQKQRGEVSYYHRWLALLSDRQRRGSFFYPSGCCLLLANELGVVPWFNEAYFMYGEDFLLGWQLQSTAGAMVRIEQVLVVHEGASSSGIGSAFYESRMVAAHLLFVGQSATNSLEWAGMALGRACTLPLRAILRAVRHRSLVPLRALWTGLRLATGRDPQRERARRCRPN